MKGGNNRQKKKSAVALKKKGGLKSVEKHSKRPEWRRSSRLYQIWGLQIYRMKMRTTVSKEAPFCTYNEYLLTGNLSTNKFRTAMENKVEKNIYHFPTTGMCHDNNACDQLKRKERNEYIELTLSCYSQLPVADTLQFQTADPLVLEFLPFHSYSFINWEGNQKW